MIKLKPFCIVENNDTGSVAAWPGDDRENRQHLGNRELLAVVNAEDDQAALLKWRVINQGATPCVSSI